LQAEKAVEKRMNKRILHLAIPNIISNLSVPLLGVADLALMGHLGTVQDIGAISLGGMIFNFIYWLFGFLRMGTTGFTAQALGKRDFPGMMMHLSKALLVAITTAAILLILQSPVGWVSFKLVGSSPEVEALTREYYRIRIWAAPATISLYAFTGWFIGMQNTRFPMLLSIVINILNIGFNALFIFVFGMRADGVALGTVLAQYSGLLLALFYFFRYYRKMLNYFTLDGIFHLTAFLRVNGNLFLRTLLLLMALSFFTVASARQSDNILAINTLLLQFFTLFAYFLDGFAYSAEALTGRFIGAADPVRLRRMIRITFLWASGLSLLFAVGYATGHNLLLKVFTNKQDIILGAQEYLHWIILIPLVTFPAFIWDGVFIGATASKQMRNVMIVATAGCFFPVYLLTVNPMGNHGLWLTFILFMATRSVLMTRMAKKSIPRLQ